MHLLDGYISANQRFFSTFLSKITKYNRVPLGFDPSVARLLGHDPTPDQLVRQDGETNNAVTQFVGDNIDFNIVSIHGNTSFHSMGWIKATSPAPPLPDPQTTAAVPRVKLKALVKAKIQRGGEVRIIIFTNRKEIGTNAIMFLPLPGS